MSSDNLPKKHDNRRWNTISQEFTETFEKDGNHILAERHGSIHFYIYCPTPESLTALHRKVDNGILEEQFRNILEIHGQRRMKKENIVVKLELVDDHPLDGMYCRSFTL